MADSLTRYFYRTYSIKYYIVRRVAGPVVSRARARRLWHEPERRGRVINNQGGIKDKTVYCNCWPSRSLYTHGSEQ